jgi:hypothetical protein
MSRRHVMLFPLAVVGALALSGCSASAGAAPVAAPSSGASTSFTTDAMTCAGFNDVLTITSNADAGLRDGRMAAQEHEGWYRLATRVLDGVPTRGAGAVSDAVTAMQEIAPAIALTAIQTTGIGSAEWDGGIQELSEACTSAGSETAVEMFTGG